MFGFIVEGEENIVGKGENAGPLLDIIIFFLSSLYFKNSVSGRLKFKMVF